MLFHNLGDFTQWITEPVYHMKLLDDKEQSEGAVSPVKGLYHVSTNPNPCTVPSRAGVPKTRGEDAGGLGIEYTQCLDYLVAA